MTVTEPSDTAAAPLVATAIDVVAAIDVGGSRIKAALVDRSLRVVTRTTEPTPPDIAHDVGTVVAGTVDRLVAASEKDGTPVRLVGCGVVVPGLVDEGTGTGLLSVNLGWRDLSIRDLVRATVGVPTVVGHDVRAGLLAEVRLGAARGARHALFVPIGTGIAGALMVDGAVLTAGGWAGELGHVQVESDGPPCPCGGRGCLEVVASASAIARAYAARRQSAPDSQSAADNPSATQHAVDARAVAAKVAAGEPDAVAVWQRAVAALARAVLATITITGIDLVVVGGGLALSGETLLAPLRTELEALRTFQRPPRVVLAELGDRAGCLGAACLAWDVG